MTLRDAYEQARKKYNLPSFNELDREFEIASIEVEENALREIRHRIHDRIEFGAGILDTICQPDPNSVRSMMECSFFGDTEKRKAYELSQKLAALWRSLTEAELLNDDKSDAEFIKHAFKEWQLFKEPLVTFVRKMRDSWKGTQTSKEELGYLG
ncbi:MAG TPA: hypothetical protein VLJ21_05215 [Candidatus Binatia bacterium]|nr:hypothetical protein [Candidatus Binatia bacterium]